MDGRFSIVDGPRAVPAPVDLAPAARDTPHGHRMDLAVLAGPCIPLVRSPAEPLAPADGLDSVRRALVLAPDPALARLARE